MSEGYGELFEPINIGQLTLSGRVYKAATSETRASPEGFVTDEFIAFYEPIARGGTPLIITGNMYVSRSGRSTRRMCGIDDDDKIPGLKKLTDAVHAHGAKIFVQLNHAGRQVVPHSVGLPEALAPSSVLEPIQGTKPRALNVGEIQQLVQDFAAAARRAQQAGFDGVQIHCAHGYLINQFLTPHTNRRRDEYGGSFDNRLRFLLEVYRAIRAQVGLSFPVIAKLNGTDYLPLRRGLSTRELVEIATALQAQGLDGVEISIGHYESGFVVFRGSFRRFFQAYIKTGLADELPWLWRWGVRLFWPVTVVFANLIWRRFEGYNLRYAREFKRALRIPVLCVGGFQDGPHMARALREGLCDVVTCARSFIADPFLYQHLKSNTPGPRCVFCNACVGRVGAEPVDCYHPKVRAQKDAMLARQDA